MAFIPVHPHCRCDWIPVIESIRYPQSFYRSSGIFIPPPIEVGPKPVPEKKPDISDNIVTYDSDGEIIE